MRQPEIDGRLKSADIYSVAPRKEKVIIATVVCTFIAAAIGVLRSLGWPHGESKSSCYACLRQIEGAKSAWMIDHDKTTNDILPLAELVGEHGYMRKMPQCPRGGTYTIGRLGESPLCSISEHNAYYRGESLPGSQAPGSHQ